MWQAARSLREAAGSVAGRGRIPFRAVNVERAGATEFEVFTAPADFRDAAVFRGRLFLCGAAGLVEVDPSGSIVASHAVGLDLPPAPLVRMTVGAAGDRGEPELWIGTQGEGLLAYDGRAFRQIRPDDNGYATVTDLLAAGTGRLLAGTAKRGVLVYDGRQLAPFHPSLEGVAVSALAGDDTELWVGTVDRGLLQWRAGELRRFGEGEGLPDGHVLGLAQSGPGLFAGTALGVAEFRDGKFQRVLAQGFLARALLPRREALLVGTLEEGVVRVPLEARPPRGLRPQGAEVAGEVRRLIELDSRTWALTAAGLQRLDGGARIPEVGGARAQLADRNVSALALDAAGQVWIGYFDRGLQILDGSGNEVRRAEDEHLFCVNRIATSEARGVAAVATANGLVILDAMGNQRQVLGREQGLISNHVTDVVVTGEGMIAATPAGITWLDGSGAHSIYAFHGLVNNHVYTLAAAGGRLMAGTLGGLSMLDGSTVKSSFTTANSSLGHNWITALAAVGEEWFAGTYGAGVLRMDTAARWHRFPDFPKNLEINPNAMAVTARAVYAGSLGRGLFAFDRGANRWRQVANGLPSQNVTAVASRSGVVYIGTDNGLVRVPESQLLP